MDSGVAVQIILYQNGLREIWRLMHGLAESIRTAQDSNLLNGHELLIGDCSPVPALGADALADLLDWMEATLGSRPTYRFFDENLMTAKGHNTLAAEHQRELIWVINPDTYPQPSALAALLRASGPGVGAVDGRQLPLEHPKSFEPNGDTSWASGFCVLYSREAFDAVGGYDNEFFPLYCDDVDISWRMRLAGFRVVHEPECAVFHDKRLGGDVHVDASEAEEYYGVYSRLMLTRRYQRPDIEEETLERVGEHGTSAQKRAVDDYRARLEANEVPAGLDAAETVAQFIDGEYATHRF